MTFFFLLYSFPSEYNKFLTFILLIFDRVHGKTAISEKGISKAINKKAKVGHINVNN